MRGDDLLDLDIESGRGLGSGRFIAEIGLIKLDPDADLFRLLQSRHRRTLGEFWRVLAWFGEFFSRCARDTSSEEETKTDEQHRDPP